MDTEACDGRTSDLGLFLIVSLFIGFLASVSRKIGLEVSTTHHAMGWAPGAPWVVGAPPGLWLPREASSPALVLQGSLLSIKNHRKFSARSENFNFCTQNDTTVVLLKAASVRVSSNQIIPKPYKIVVNMA